MLKYFLQNLTSRDCDGTDSKVDSKAVTGVVFEALNR